MKHTQLTSKEDRTERGFFSLVCMAVLAGLLLISALSSCKAQLRNESYIYVGMQGTPAQAERFLECAKDEGDQGCDSCYYLVYGKHIDPYTGNVEQ